VSVYSSDQKLTEPNEGLIRRVWKTPRKKYGPVHDQLTDRLRAPAAAFEPRFPDPQKPDRPVDEALSINVESSLRAAGLPLTWSVDLRKQYAARITVGDCIANDLEAYHNPLPETPSHPANPHHGLIRGLVELRASNRDGYERVLDALAKASTILPDQPMLSGTESL
jgi:hypothetical protein